MLPWAYTMSGFTLHHKVCSIATVHLTKCLYISTCCICLFGIWGIMPSFTLKLGRRAYITMVCSLLCCYIGQHAPSASSVGSGGVSHDEDLHLGCQAMLLVIMHLTAYLWYESVGSGGILQWQGHLSWTSGCATRYHGFDGMVLSLALAVGLRIQLGEHPLYLKTLY